MVSVDDAETNKRFATEHDADFPILSDPEKRARYDRFGHEAAAGGFGDDAGHVQRMRQVGLARRTPLPLVHGG